MREMGAFDLPKIIHGDAKTASIPVIAMGEGGDQALMEAFRAGCDDYVDVTALGREPSDRAARAQHLVVGVRGDHQDRAVAGYHAAASIDIVLGPQQNRASTTERFGMNPTPGKRCSYVGWTNSCHCTLTTSMMISAARSR